MHACTHTHAPTHIHTHVHMCVYIYRCCNIRIIYIYIYHLINKCIYFAIAILIAGEFSKKKIYLLKKAIIS